ncbi:ABC transporter permease [Inconstantimicrobium mannanitabidum]|uniref:ABC transporter permease n=1 Tax=Inconstantimicrobium mannanitabidum TaxID=1604901 RepID=A0ACB5RG66_9CLOT|nr:ABC transporter permease subunit [Clostridium sp. TW13]GKX68085.1 ABC transporter permease [Clostridium sp. TW13]
MKKYLGNKIRTKLIFTAVWVFIWYCVAEGIDNEILLPSPLNVVNCVMQIVTTNEFVNVLFSSLERVVLSFIVSLVLSIIIAAVSSRYNIFNDFLSPIILILKSIPTMAFVIIILIWLDKNSAPFLIGVMISFPIFYDTTLNAIKSVNKDLINMADIYEVGAVKKIIYIYIPSVSFAIQGILSSTLSLILKVVVAGEIYGQPKYGIGASLQLEKMYLNTAGIFAWIVIIALISIVFTFLSNIVERIVYRWKRE